MWRPCGWGRPMNRLNARQPDEPPKRWSRLDPPSRFTDMSKRQNELVVTLPETAAIEVRRSGGLVPAMIAAGGEQASWRYIEFFTANIRNKNTRRAYARACTRFFAWCESRNLKLTAIRPFDVAAYVEMLQGDGAAPSV